jgi:hypothetical protein
MVFWKKETTNFFYELKLSHNSQDSQDRKADDIVNRSLILLVHACNDVGFATWYFLIMFLKLWTNFHIVVTTFFQ